MRELGFIQADVFTGEAFGGNQLAIFPEGEGLPVGLMETLAREMNFSESTFVQRSTKPSCAARVRICVPGKEIPFAGHPTVGTAAVMHLRGVLPARCELELGVGPVAVESKVLGERRAHATMTQPRTAFGPPVPQLQEAADSLGLAQRDIETSFPVRAASAGLEFLLVGVRSREALARIVVRPDPLGTLLERAAAHAVYVYTLDAPDPGGHVHARMFAPFLGILEDPATGSAAGPLAAHLAACGVPEALPGRVCVIRQGLEMGRPSRIECSVLGLANANAGVRVGGEAVVVGEGRIFLDA